MNVPYKNGSKLFISWQQGKEELTPNNTLACWLNRCAYITDRQEGASVNTKDFKEDGICNDHATL